MIYSTFDSLKDYYGTSKNLDTAIDFILGGGLDTLELGRNEVDGDNVFVMHFAYETLPAQDCCFEAHHKYGDIHIILEGKEYLGVTPIEALTLQSDMPEQDAMVLGGNIDVLCPLHPKVAAIAFPADGHLVKLLRDEAMPVKKAVVKFKCDT